MTLLQDFRYGARGLARSPGFTIVAVITLGLGIGANTTIFSVVNALLLRPPAHVQAPEQLVWMYTSDFSGPRYGASSYPDYEVFREQSQVVSGIAAFVLATVSLHEGGAVLPIGAELVNPEYFEVLGVSPVRGRAFEADDGRGAQPVAMISHDLWQDRFGGDPAVIGRAIRLNASSFTVIGVAPAGFTGSLRGPIMDVWVPIEAEPLISGEQNYVGQRGNRGMFLIGRLREGVSLERAQAQFDVVARRLHEVYPEMWTDVNDRGRVVTLIPEREGRVLPQARTQVLGFAGLLLVVVGLVLLICCVNVASLVVARAARRTRELGVRAALGASRRRLLRQLLAESLVLATLGGAAGLLIAFWARELIFGFQPAPIRIGLDLDPDARVLGFTLLVTVATALLFGLAPALRAARPDVLAALKSDGPTGESRHGRFTLRNVLVVAQVAISVVLLVGAGLFVRSLQAAASVEPGFDPDNVAVAFFDLRTGYDAAGRRAFYDQLAERVGALPGVEAVTYAERVPLSAGTARRGTTIEGYEPPPGDDMEFHFNVVDPGYFEALRIPMARGRTFTAHDRSGAPGAAVVNEAFARRFWPNEDPIGKRLSWTGGATWMEVVGIARDGKYVDLAEEGLPYVYGSARQADANLVLHARVREGMLADILPAIRREIQALDADLPILELSTMEAEMAERLMPQRVGATMIGLFGALALILTAVGLYGLVAYVATQRTREIGIRLAVGAAPSSVLRLVLGQGVRVAGVGLLVGLVLAFAASRLVTSFLFGVSPYDAPAFLGVVVLLGAVVVLASWLPARRAAAIDPVRAIRYE